MELNSLIEQLSAKMPAVFRWAGALAKQLRQHNITVESKESGYANTDALTLADLTVQELLVGALRDLDPMFRACRIEGEEETGDLDIFATDAKYTIALDPIDGTKQFRDTTGDGYAVMLNVRSVETVHYSLVFLPEMGASGTWVEVKPDQIRCGPDDRSKTANEVLAGIAPVDVATRPDSKQIYMIGFLDKDIENAQAVTDAGLVGFPPNEMPGSIYPLFATGEFGGSLIHTPNIYDFPVSLHIARVLGGDARWCHNGKSVDFADLWMDDRSNMLRMPGVVACSHNPETLKTLVEVGKDWDLRRYID